MRTLGFLLLSLGVLLASGEDVVEAEQTQSYPRAVPISNITLIQRGHRGENAPSVLRLKVTHPNDAGCDTEAGCSFVVGMFVGGWQWKGNKTLPTDFKGLHTGKHRFNRAFLGGVAKGEITKRAVWRWEGAFWRRMVDLLVQDLEVEGEEEWKLKQLEYKSEEEREAEAKENAKWKKDWEVMRAKRLKREARRAKEKEAKRQARLQAAQGEVTGEGVRVLEAEASPAPELPEPAAGAAAGKAGGKKKTKKSKGKKAKKADGKKKKKLRKRRKIKKPEPTPTPTPAPFVPVREHDEVTGEVIVRDTYSIITITSSGNWIFDHSAVGENVRINVAMWQGNDWADEVPDNSEADVIWSHSIRKLWRG